MRALRRNGNNRSRIIRSAPVLLQKTGLCHQTD